MRTEPLPRWCVVQICSSLDVRVLAVFVLTPPGMRKQRVSQTLSLTCNANCEAARHELCGAAKRLHRKPKQVFQKDHLLVGGGGIHARLGSVVLSFLDCPFLKPDNGRLRTRLSEVCITSLMYLRSWTVLFEA